MLFGTKDDKKREQIQRVKDALEENPIWMGWENSKLVVWKYDSSTSDGYFVFVKWRKGNGGGRSRVILHPSQILQSINKKIMWPAVIQGFKKS